MEFKDVEGITFDETYAMLEGEISKLCIKNAFLENADVVEQADKVVFRRLEYKIATKEEVKNSLQTIMRMMNTFYNRKDSRVAIEFRYFKKVRLTYGF